MISYHPRARLTVEQRREIKENKEGLSLKELAKRYNVSIPTIQKWKRRDRFEDAPHGTKDLYNVICNGKIHQRCKLKMCH